MTQDRPGNRPDLGLRTSLRIILGIKRGSLEDCSAHGLPDQVENQSAPWSLGGLEMAGQWAHGGRPPVVYHDGRVLHTFTIVRKGDQYCVSQPGICRAAHTRADQQIRSFLAKGAQGWASIDARGAAPQSHRAGVLCLGALSSLCVPLDPPTGVRIQC